jgi:hypothetical protein
MQMKQLSPENYHVTEVDTVHRGGRQYGAGIGIGEIPAALSGSESAAWHQRDNVGAWETQGEPRRPVDRRRAATEPTGSRVEDDKPLKARNPR